MSDTSSSSVAAANHIATAILRDVARTHQHRRLLLTKHLGVDPQLVMKQLKDRFNESVVLASEELGVIRQGAIVLIPYLVAGIVEAGANQGSRGFAALLRDRFLEGVPPGDVRVLLILDSTPVETVLTASEDISQAPELQWRALCRQVADEIEEDERVGEFLRTIVDDFRDRLPPSGVALGHLSLFAGHRWRDAEQVGEQLYKLGPYLSDPRALRSPARFVAGARWRAKLESWTAPGEGLERRLVEHFGAAHDAVEKVLAAAGPFEIDYAKFTLDDLGDFETDTDRIRFVTPISVAGAAASLASGMKLAVWLPGGQGRFAVRFKGTPRGDERAQVTWIGASGPSDCTLDGHQKLVTVDVSGSGWRFGTLALVADGAQLHPQITIAAYFEKGTWFPIERQLDITVGSEAFAVDGSPEALAIAPRRAPRPAALDGAEGEPGQYLVARASLDGEQHSLPIIFVGENPPEDARGEVASPVHALLEAAIQRGEADVGSVAFQSIGKDAIITVGGAQFRLESQMLSDASGLELEREILRKPDVWAFTIRRDGGLVELVPDVGLERLSLPDLPISRFKRARQAFFETIRGAGSVLGLASGQGAIEALEYCAAYADLIDAVPPTGRYRREFDRLLLVDALTDPATQEVLIAPTNPVTVAFYLAFASAAHAWCKAAAGEILRRDIGAISPRHILPLFSLVDHWHESLPAGPFLWRRYRRIQAGTSTEYHPKYIARRLEFFLAVHPAYCDPRQTVVVGLHEPGDGVSVCEALRAFYEPDLGSESTSRPRLQLYLFTASAARPPAIDELLAGGEQIRPVDRLVRSRVTVSVLPADAPVRFCHVSFMFKSPAQQTAGPEDMRERASTAFVGGLATTTGRAVASSPNQQLFAWGTFGSRTCGDPGTGQAGALLARCLRRTLELVGGQPRERLEPHVTRMSRTTVEPGFLEEVYENSVWVVHLDRMIGLEAFAPAAGGGSRYLIDYDERADLDRPGIDAITATTHIEPYLDSISRALRDLGNPTDRALGPILRLLNSVSGRWALQLLRRSENQVRERIGTVAAIAMLEQLDESFSRESGTGLLVPLEEVFQALPDHGLARPENRCCDDLLYLWVTNGPGPVVVRGRLIEVKYRSSAPPDFGEARRELEETRSWLQDIFNAPEPRRLFRARDLAEMIRASVARGQAFGLLQPFDRQPLEAALQSISNGEFRLELEFWVDGIRHEGDVVSVEVESRAPAVRRPLPGDGPVLGLVRLGRDWLEALAAGASAPRPTGWQRPEFAPPGQKPPPPAATGGPRGQTPGGTQRGHGARRKSDPSAGPSADSSQTPGVSNSDTAAEVGRAAKELDAAVLKYGLELEPFLPERAQVGPSVIRFRTRPLGRQALAGVQRFALDLGREVGVAEGVLVDQEPYYITIDVPRAKPDVITFAEHGSRLDAPAEPGALSFLLGMAPSGDVRIEDLARLPHLLVAGATGSGKSVFLRGVISSLVRNRSPEELRLLMVDPKHVDFLPFAELPHLVEGRIISDPGEAVTLLGETIGKEIERRRPILNDAGVTSALEFYEGGGGLRELPQMVVVIDEFADLAATLGRDERATFMTLVQRYGQLTRAFGIYLVLATQRPSVQVITGDIKANLTARAALKVQATQDSMTILGRAGAERLRDKGDMLFDHAGRTERLQGFLTTAADARAAVARAKK